MSKIKDIEQSLSFDDILILPNFSSVSPAEVDLKVNLNQRLAVSSPIVSAAMDTVTGYEMARAMIAHGGMGVLHKNSTFECIVDSLKKLKKEFGPSSPIAVSIGTNSTDSEIRAYVESGANVIVVDSAHGHSQNVGDLVQKVSIAFPDVFLIAGNVVTQEGAIYLMDKGANAIKVGIGPGSICITRVVTGVGRGQITAIADVATVTKPRGVLVIADGGIRSVCDIMKAFVVGADLAMLGYMLSGTTETPGEVIEIDGKKYKPYRGMGSLNAMKAGSANRYNQDGQPDFKMASEGVEGYVSYKGDVQYILTNIDCSLKSGCGYVGAQNMKDLFKKAKLTKITTSVCTASKVHSIEKVISINNIN